MEPDNFKISVIYCKKGNNFTSNIKNNVIKNRNNSYDVAEKKSNKSFEPFHRESAVANRKKK